MNEYEVQNFLYDGKLEILAKLNLNKFKNITAVISQELFLGEDSKVA